MASVSSLSSSSSIYGSRNSHIISGLASGMDTESMIEGMVQGIKSKIDKQKQQQTILGWQQQAYRSISDQLVSLSTKYTSYTSSTNLMSQDFFKPSIITALGKYASSISASGSTSSNIEILKASKAQTESISFTGLNGVADSSSNSVVGKFEQGADIGIDIVNGKGEDISAFEGKYITFEYNNKTYTIDLPADPSTLGTKKDGTQYSYDSAKDVADVINKQLSEIKVGDSDKLSDYIQVGTNDKGTAGDTSDDVIEISLTNKSSGNFEITGGSSEALQGLGLEKGDKISSTATDKKLTGDTFSTTVKKDIKDLLIGSTITLNYNGQSEIIAFPNKAEYEEILKAGDANAVNKAFEDFLQKKIDKAFGYGRIDVTNTLEGDGSGLFNLGFELKGSNANNDTLSITSGSTGLVGSSSIFGFDFGASNRINTNDTLAELGIKLDGMNAVKGVGTPTLQDDGKTYKDDNGNIVDKDGNRLDAKGNKIYALNINGVEIGQYTQDSKLSTIMSDINNSDAGVKVTYSSTTNQFVFTATNGGSGGRVEINNDNNNNLAAAIFGSVTYDNSGNMQVTTMNEDGLQNVVVVDKDGNSAAMLDGTYGVNVTRGKDASITAVINGVEKTLTSGTNAFTIDGLAITVNSGFEVKGDESGVTFNQSVDTDKIVDAVKTFVEEYNKMLADLGTAYTTQPSKGYTALTDDQKADMTEKQIEEYEKKAKEGILFADSDLKSLASDLRFLFSDSALEEIGITTSTEASDRGKLSIDENKLRAAIEGNLDSVKDAFAAPLDEKGVNGGAMPKLKEVLDKYAATTGAVKGILIEKAGSQFSPSALLNNQIKSEIEDIDEIIDKLTDQLNDKIDFYTSKFSKLEVLISQMNSQSSYLSGMSGGY